LFLILRKIVDDPVMLSGSFFFFLCRMPRIAVLSSFSLLDTKAQSFLRVVVLFSAAESLFSRQGPDIAVPLIEGYPLPGLLLSNHLLLVLVFFSRR